MDQAVLENIKAMVKDAVGEAKAEITAEATKLTASLEKQFGSLDAAKAAGQTTNFFEREGMAANARKTANDGKQHKAGRYLRLIAQARGNLDAAKSMATARGEHDLAKAVDSAIKLSQEKAMSYSDFSAGGALVPEEFSAEVIGLLYSQLAVMELGADMVPMPSGSLTIPFLDTGVTAYYVGEVQNITPSQQATGQLQLVAKKLAAIVPISNDLLRTPSANADRFVQNDLLRRLKVRSEQAFIRGTGVGEPKGIRNHAIAGNVNAISGATLQNKVDDLGSCQRRVKELDVPLEKGGYIIAPRTEWALKQTLDGLGNFVFMKAMEAGVLMGVPFRSTTIIPTNLAGSNSEIIFGAFAHVLIGDTEQIEISAHPDGAFFDGSSVQAGVSLDVTPMRAIARHDLACRYRGKEIAVLTGVTY